MIYLTMTAINLVLPFLWIISFLYLSIVFAGFPYASLEARARLNALVRMGGIWTVARLVWGFIALTSVVQGWLEYAQDSVHSYSFILVGTRSLCCVCMYFTYYSVLFYSILHFYIQCNSYCHVLRCAHTFLALFHIKLNMFVCLRWTDQHVVHCERNRQLYCCWCNTVWITHSYQTMPVILIYDSITVPDSFVSSMRPQISIFTLTEILPIALGLQPSVVESLTDKVSPLSSYNKGQGGRVSSLSSTGGGGRSSSAIIVIGMRVPGQNDISAGAGTQRQGTGAAATSSAASSLSTSSYVTSRSLSSHFSPSPPRPYSFPEAAYVPYSFTETTDVSVHMRQPLLSAQHTLPGGESSWECSRGTSRTSLSELNDASSSHSSILKSSPDQPSPLRSASARSSGRDHVLGNNRYFAVPQPFSGAADDSDDTEEDSNDDSTGTGRRGVGQRTKRRKRSSAPTVGPAPTSRFASQIDTTVSDISNSNDGTMNAGTNNEVQSLRGRLVQKISGWLGY